MKVCPRSSVIEFSHHLPRAGLVRVSVDRDGRVRVRPRGVSLGSKRTSPGWALGGLNLGMVGWDPFVYENATLTPTEREAIDARIESALKHAVDSRWFNHPSIGW